MTDHKKPGVAFWATVALVVIVLYVVSLGPACWASSRLGLGAGAVSATYWPLWVVALRNEKTADALGRYARSGAPRGWNWIDFTERGEPPEWFWLPY